MQFAKNVLYKDWVFDFQMIKNQNLSNQHFLYHTFKEIFISSDISARAQVLKKKEITLIVWEKRISII